MSQWLDRLQQAINALGDNRLRTALSILGITIGIAAVMVVSTISKGGNHLVYSELETFGLNSVWVFRDWENDSPLRKIRPGSGIVESDMHAVAAKAESLGIAGVTPIVRIDWNSLVRRNANYARAQILGVGVDYQHITNDHLIAGRSLMRHDISQRQPVALLAPDAASKLFDPGVDPLGKSIRVANRRFTVIGLLAGKSRDFLASIGSSGGQSADDRVIVPYTTLFPIRGDRDIDNLQIEVLEFGEAAGVADAVSRLLAQRHRNDYQYKSEIMASYIATTDRILGGVRIVGIIAASISLLVGGMGIMNMMGTSVLERTREIGLRKAVGARERDIRRQFLLEAMLISLFGGLLGLAIGAGGSVLLAWISGFPLVPSTVSIVGALLVSVAVGIVSGLIPAIRAAKMRPVEALRSN